MERGVINLKRCLMVGLPTGTEDDVAEIMTLKDESIRPQCVFSPFAEIVDGDLCFSFGVDNVREYGPGASGLSCN